MSIPKKIVQLVLERDDYRCVIASPHCTGVATVADHRVGRGMGGNKKLNVPENLIAACAVDNGLKESDVRVARDCIARGLSLVRSQSTVRDLQRVRHKPVTFPDGSVWYLLPDGSRVEQGEGF